MMSFYSNGKLLLTSEYVVLDGALALALPTQKGQSLRVEETDKPILNWKSIDANGSIWFEEDFNLKDISSTKYNNEIAEGIKATLTAAKKLNPKFLNGENGYNVETVLQFARDWGLGSSSTLINNIAQWAEVNPYKLLELTFGGSGYDIACAENNTPITYQLRNGQPVITPISFRPKFIEHLYFVHLNRKQNSREGISLYKSKKNNTTDAISKISAITKLICNCDALITFEGLVNKHEQIISKLLNKPTVKETLFSDFKGSIKSLGAWGGDFILATSQSDPSPYFKAKGFETIIPYRDMILN